MKVVSILMTLFFYFFSESMQAASFDCAKASTSVEKMVCSDEELSEKDEILANIYNQLREKTNNYKKLKSEQLSWLRQRNQCEENKICLLYSYADRIHVLRSKKEYNHLGLTMPQVGLYQKRPSGSFKLLEGFGDSVCKIFLDAINEERDSAVAGDIELIKSFDGDIDFKPLKKNLDVPELIIQTKLNLNKRAIDRKDTRFIDWRDEEIEVVFPNNEKIYVYRSVYFRSSAYIHDYLLVSKKSYFENSNSQDFFSFVREIKGAGLHPKSYIKSEWPSAGVFYDSGIYPDDAISELINISGNIYVVQTSPYLRYGKPIRVYVSRLNSDFIANPRCLLESYFSVVKY